MIPLTWSPFGILGIAAAFVAFAMGGFVLANGLDRPSNRRLALVLMVEGISVGTLDGLLEFVGLPRDAPPVLAVGIASLLALPWLYAWFLSTLETPLVRVLRSRAANVILLVGGAASVVFGITRLSAFVTVNDPTEWAGLVTGPAFTYLQYGQALIYVFGLIAALHAHKIAKTEIGKKQAWAFVIAFGVRDALYALYAVYLVLIAPAVIDANPDLLLRDDLLASILVRYSIPPFVTFAYVPLIAYGILKLQLFDIDLKIKVGIKRTTIGATFLAVFVLVSEIAKSFLSDKLGITAGAVASMGLFFVAGRVESFAGRVAEKAVPQASAAPEYLTFKKFEVYRAACEGAFADGIVTDKERSMLAKLREKLGIRAEDATAMEADVLDALGLGAARPRPA